MHAHTQMEKLSRYLDLSDFWGVGRVGGDFRNIHIIEVSFLCFGLITAYLKKHCQIHNHVQKPPMSTVCAFFLFFFSHPFPFLAGASLWAVFFLFG